MLHSPGESAHGLERTTSTLEVAEADRPNERHVLLAGSDVLRHAVWAPDGRAIATIALRETSDSIDVALRVVPLVGGDPIAAPLPVEDWNCAPSWSPDSRELAYYAHDHGERVLVRWRVGEQRIRRVGPGGCPAWSPDGKQIAIARVGVVGDTSQTLGRILLRRTRRHAPPNSQGATRLRDSLGG